MINNHYYIIITNNQIKCSALEGVERGLGVESAGTPEHFNQDNLGSISNFATGFQKFHLSWEESILQLYIFIWNMKSKVLDSQQWWSSIIIINLCSCNGLLASEGPDRRVYASEFELLNKLWWWSYIVNVRHIWWTSVMYDRRHILWMSIINEYDGCPSCMTYGCQSYMYDGCPSYLMFYSHKFPSYMWTSFVI